MIKFTAVSSTYFGELILVYKEVFPFFPTLSFFGSKLIFFTSFCLLNLGGTTASFVSEVCNLDTVLFLEFILVAQLFFFSSHEQLKEGSNPSLSSTKFAPLKDNLVSEGFVFFISKVKG